MKQEAKPVIRATKETQHQLKVIAAFTGETMQEVIARLIRIEYEYQLEQKGGKSHEQKETE